MGCINDLKKSHLHPRMPATQPAALTASLLFFQSAAKNRMVQGEAREYFPFRLALLCPQDGKPQMTERGEGADCGRLRAPSPRFPPALQDGGVYSFLVAQRPPGGGAKLPQWTEPGAACGARLTSIGAGGDDDGEDDALSPTPPESRNGGGRNFLFVSSLLSPRKALENAQEKYVRNTFPIIEPSEE